MLAAYSTPHVQQSDTPWHTARYRMEQWPRYPSHEYLKHQGPTVMGIQNLLAPYNDTPPEGGPLRSL